MEKKKISNFKDWLQASGMNKYAFSKFAKMSPTTIGNLVAGRSPTAQTVRRLVKVSAKLPIPITFDVFPRVYIRGSYETISGPELFKRLMEKILKIKRSAF